MVQFEQCALSLKDQARDRAYELFSNGLSPCVLVIDPILTAPVNALLGARHLLSRCGVTKLQWLDAVLAAGQPPPLQPQTLTIKAADRRVFLVPPLYRSCAKVALYMKMYPSAEYYLLFSPHRDVLAEAAIEEEGLWGQILSVDILPLWLAPIDHNVFSLEMPDVFYDRFVLESSLYTHTIAKSIAQLCGREHFKHMQCSGFGEFAKEVSTVVKWMQNNEREPPSASSNPLFSHIIFIDRTVDMCTPLLSQLTYAGMLADVLHLHGGGVRLPPDNKFLALDGTEDSTFRAIRDDLFFWKATAKLAVLAKDLTDRLASRPSQIHDSSLSDMQDFMEQLKGPDGLLKAKEGISQHTDAALLIKKIRENQVFYDHVNMERDMIEGAAEEDMLSNITDLMYKGKVAPYVLRLVCVLSQTCGGMKKDAFDAIRRAIVLHYGFQHILTLDRLAKVGALVVKPAEAFQIGRKQLQVLLPSKAGESGDVRHDYVPLSIRLVETMLSGQSLPSFFKPLAFGTGRRCSSLVYFLGGCTHTELAALKSVGERMSLNLVVATTCLTDGDSLLEPLLQTL